MTAARGTRTGARAAGEMRAEFEGLAIRAGHGGWYVRHAWHADRLSPILPDRAAAEAWRAAQIVAVRAARGEGPKACLCCGQTFDSSGRHNRLCPICSTAASGLSAQMVG